MANARNRPGHSPRPGSCRGTVRLVAAIDDQAAAETVAATRPPSTRRRDRDPSPLRTRRVRLVGELAGSPPPGEPRGATARPPLTMARSRDDRSIRRPRRREQRSRIRERDLLRKRAGIALRARRTTDNPIRTDSRRSGRASARAARVHLEQRPAEADAARIVVVDEDVRLGRERIGHAADSAGPRRPLSVPPSTDRPMS